MYPSSTSARVQARAFATWLLILVIVLGAAVTSLADAVPTAITYQGRLTDTTGAAVPDAAYQMQFKLFTAAENGTAFWTSSTMQVQTVSGIFTALLDAIGASDLAGKPDVYLETWVGNPLTALAPRVKLASAPFALRSSDLVLPFTGTVATGASALSITNSGGGHAVYATTSSSSASNAGRFEATSGSNSSPAVYASTFGTGQAVYGLHSASGNYGALGMSDRGVYGASSQTSGNGLYGEATGAQGRGIYAFASGADGRAIHAYATGTTGHGIYAYTIGTSGEAIHAEAAGSSGVGIYAKGGASGLAGQFAGNVRLVTRDASPVTVMELGTGLDYAEGFKVTQKDKVAAGCVLTIDPKNSGKLTRSSKAYDRRVAGIVAGANNLGSGVRLGVDGFDHSVALAGRVYCNVDATKVAVQPGDMLTTSSTPGYAMRVTNHSRAQGAILGKAMEGLARGKRGQILVLVTLQ